MHKPLKYFSFLVVSYNHEKYILEHLESIKFLIENYGSDLQFQIIINDDCSKDKTTFFVDAWLDANAALFYKINKIYNNKNIGTCASILNMLEKVEGDYLKLTAGDDVYSCENLFLALPFLDQHTIVSGIPLDLRDGAISIKKTDVNNIIASSIVYEKSLLINRLKWLSIINAPNIFYSKKHLFTDPVKKFVSQFDVVEDWPIQVAIAESDVHADFELLEKVFVYYRRTAGSTYIIAGSRFYSDQVKMFNYLILNEKNVFRRIMLKNRLFCFSLKNRIVKKLFNIAFYVYVTNFIMKWVRIRKKIQSLDLSINRHKEHYSRIKHLAESFNRESY